MNDLHDDMEYFIRVVINVLKSGKFNVAVVLMG